MDKTALIVGASRGLGLGLTRPALFLRDAALLVAYLE